MGFLTAIFFTPPFITFAFIYKYPAISMAPQKEISPSPWQKWMSPADSSPPFTYTGRKTFDPIERFLMSQFPPCSLGGMDRAPSLLTLSAASPESLPTTAPLSVGSLANAGTRCGSVSNNFFSRLFHSASNSWEGAVPMMPG